VRTGRRLGSVGTWRLLTSAFHVARAARRQRSEASVPDSLSRSQCEGALRRFWCFFGPRPILTVL
jgi:hypothetical protein